MNRPIHKQRCKRSWTTQTEYQQEDKNSLSRTQDHIRSTATGLEKTYTCLRDL